MDLTLREILDRYGPTLAVIAALALLFALLPNANRVDSASSVAQGPLTTSTTGAAGVSQDTTGVTGGELTAGGSTEGVAAQATRPGAGTGRPVKGAVEPVKSAVEAAKSCRVDGRQPGISRYMPPCLALFTGDNTGATARGVFKDKIIVSRFMSQPNAATQAALVAAGADDNREDQDRMDAAITRYFNAHIETYGREVVIKTVEASGPDSNDQPMRADAVKIAEEVKAFANWGGPTVLAEELAARGVICICTTSLSRTFYQKTKGYIFSSLPTIEEYYAHMAEYIGKRLNNRNARWSGNAAMQALPRKFGLIFQEASSAGPVANAKDGRDFFVSELAKYGATLTRSVGYSSDLTKAQEQSTNVVTQLKEAGVSTVVLIGDPLTPIFITQESTRQAWFPEWLISGTALTDTTFFGRTYDQAQWSHAFGISPLWVFWVDVSTSSGYREYHHIRPQDPRGEEGVSINVRRAPLQWIFLGIHMAGPKLTPQTYAQGMYAFPRSGGVPNAPLVFFTPESPNAIKDFTEVWWNPTGSGKDETGKEGAGTLMKVDGGKRYLAGGWPTTEPKAFDPNGAVYTKDLEDPVHEQDGHQHAPDVKCLSCAK